MKHKACSQHTHRKFGLGKYLSILNRIQWVREKNTIADEKKYRFNIIKGSLSIRNYPLLRRGWGGEQLKHAGGCTPRPGEHAKWALVQFMVLDSQTPETPNIPNFENIGSPGVQTPETPKTLKMLRQLGVSGVWTPGLPIPLKYGILGVSGVWESGLPKPSILVVLGVQESNQLTIA